jgi:hypothetical protein
MSTHLIRSCIRDPQALRLIQLACDVGELALLQLGLPEDGIRVVESVLDPAVLLDVVQVDEPTRVRVTMGSGKDTSSAELQRRIVLEIVTVFGIEYTVGESLTGADTEEVAGKTGAVAVDVVEGGAFLRGDAGAHCTLGLSVRGTAEVVEVAAYHAQTHALVRVHQVGQNLGCRGDRDAALVSELVQTTLHAEVCEPVLAVLYTSISHSDFNPPHVRTAAPPAMVPSKQLLISMTFLTV